MYQPAPPTFGAPYPQPSGFGQPAPGGWAPSSSSNDERFGGKAKDPLLVAIKWLKARSQKEKMYMGVAAAVLTILLLYFVIEDHDTLFIMSEAVHFIGIGFLAYKLLRKKNVGDDASVLRQATHVLVHANNIFYLYSYSSEYIATYYSQRSVITSSHAPQSPIHFAGLSLRTQELTALFLAVRLFCSVMMEYDIHTVLDLLTLGATGGVIFALRGPLKQAYQADLDSTHPLIVIVPCFVMALIAHPSTKHSLPLRVLWALCVYLEAVSVLPQLRMMQKAKVVEKFTAHYVFALGLSRFISCAHWVLQILEGDRFLWSALGSGLWPMMVLVSEIVQTFILADFCYYYVKSFAEGTGIIQLPAGVV